MRLHETDVDDSWKDSKDGDSDLNPGVEAEISLYVPLADVNLVLQYGAFVGELFEPGGTTDEDGVLEKDGEAFEIDQDEAQEEKELFCRLPPNVPMELVPVVAIELVEEGGVVAER